MYPVDSGRLVFDCLAELEVGFIFCVDILTGNVYNLRSYCGRG
jgi:hypothetical protein